METVFLFFPTWLEDRDGARGALRDLILQRRDLALGMDFAFIALGRHLKWKPDVSLYILLTNPNLKPGLQPFF
jgi:hypothetical protein